MHKTLTRLLLAAAALVLIAIVAIIVIVSRFDYNRLKPRVSQEVYNATGRELVMEGDIKLRLGLTPNLTVDSVSFANAEWGTRPHMATVDRLEVQVALIPLLRRDIDIKRLVLIGPDILIETDPTGKSNLVFEKPAERAEPPPPTEEPQEEPAGRSEIPLAFNRLQIENGRLMFRNGETGNSQTATLLELSAVASDRRGPIKLEAKGAYNENPFELSGSVGSIAAAVDPEQPWPLNLKVETLGTAISLDGAIHDVLGAKGIDIHMVAQGQSVREIATLAGLREVPEIGPFSVAGKLTDPSAKTYRFSEFKLMLPDSDLTGSVEIVLSGERPRLNATLQSQKIDFRPLLAKDEAEAGAPVTPAQPQPKREKVFSEHDLPLDIVRKLDGQAGIRAGQILLPRLALTDVSAEIVLENGTLTIRPIKASAGGGSFDGQIRLAARGETPELNLTAKINQLDMGPMLAELGITDRLEGRLDADFQLSGRGKSSAELMAGLNGTTITMMQGGRVNNKYLSLLEANLGSGLFNLLNPAAENTQYTDLNCFVSRFDITNGIADSTVLLVDTASMTVLGDGSIDLRTERLNLSLVPTPKQGVLAQAGAKVGLNLGELVKPFKLGGTLAAPKLAVDLKQSAFIVGKAVGGTALFGPAGIAAVLAGGSGPGDDPCSAAMKIAETGEAPKAGADQRQKGVVEQLPQDLSEAAKGLAGETEQQLKKFFGR